MKAIVSLLFVALLFGCKNKSANPYDPSNYILVETDSFRGKIGTQSYVFKDDTSRKLVLNYWDNGKLMAKSFMYQGQMDGRFEMYDYNGELTTIDSFVNGKKVFEKYLTPSDTSIKILNNGKLESFNSIDSFKK